MYGGHKNWKSLTCMIVYIVYMDWIDLDAVKLQV